MKYIDDSVVVKVAKITAIKNQWLNQQAKAIAETKPCLKKTTNTEKRKRKKADKTKKKS